MKKNYFPALMCMLLFTSLFSSAQELPVIIQAEAGVPGSDFRIVDTLDVTAVTINTNSGVDNPLNDARVITFQVTFPSAGEYELYAHILVGNNGYNDDSYFCANGFGEKTSNLSSDWIMINGLAGAGYSSSTDVVEGNGSVGSGAWKWLNISRFNTAVAFNLAEGDLTKTYQIAAREDGLYIDQLIFGKKGLFFTVANLNLGEAGSETDPRLAPAGTPLADGQEKFLGSAWDYVQAPEFASYWNQSTPGNAGKWGSVEYTRDVMNWTMLDSTYNVARRYNMLFKEHTLIWGAQQPPWIGSLDSAAQRQEIEEWFQALSQRYPDIEYIDVVNEPIHNAPNGMVPWGTTEPNVDYAQALGGAGETGWDWIITSFRLARQYFPQARLIMNEYSVINSASTTQTYIEIINLLKAENLIDGIGEQGHAFTTYGTSSATLKANLDLLAETGIPIYITELDIDGPTDLTQLKEYQRVFPLFWEHPAVAGVTLWGYRYGVWRQDEKAYIIDNNNVDRPAMTWLKAYVNDTLTLMESLEVSGENPGTADTLYVGEKLQLHTQVYPWNTTIPNVLWSVNFTTLASIDQTGLLTATGAGIVTVKATAWDGSLVSDTRTVVILSNQVESIQVSAADNQNSVYVNETIQMSASVLPEDASIKTVSWSVSPPEKAFINVSGLMKGKIAGLVTVTATAQDGSGISGSLQITIMNRLTESIEVSSREDSVYKGESLQCYAKVLPDNATDPGYTWSVLPAELAEISATGLLTGLQEGKVTVTATANDESGVSGSKEISVYVDHTGIGSALQDRIHIFPNPSSDGHFRISGLSGEEGIEILNTSGQLIFVQPEAGNQDTEINLQGYQGIYFIRISGKNQVIVTKKISIL